MHRTETPANAAASHDSELAAGTRVGLYLVERKLGQGGMGTVYLAADPVLHKTVAIKVLSGTVVGVGAAQRFLNEAKATVAVEHPHIVSVFQFGQLEDGRLYYVMEYVAGRTLAARLADQDLDAEETRRLLLQLCGALSAAHSRGIVHRDLKPENISIAQPDFAPSAVKVLDFGLVKIEGSEKLTRTGTLMGSPPYMAPEQCSGTPVGPAADLYALGVILYEVFAGRLPFETDFIRAHLVNTPPPPSQFAEVPPALEGLILQCLEKDPARRPRDAAEVSRRLAEALGPAGPRPAARGGVRPVRSTTASAPTGVALAGVAPAAGLGPTLAPLVATEPPARPRRGPYLGLLGAAAIAGAAGLWYAQAREAGPAPTPPAAATTAPAVPVVTAPPAAPPPAVTAAPPAPAAVDKKAASHPARPRRERAAPEAPPTITAAPVTPPPAASGGIPDADDILIRTYPK